MEEKMVSVVFVHWAMNEERSKLARESLESLLSTLHGRQEVIVVDNGENLADSAYFLEKTQGGEIQCYIRNARNMHFAHARNQGVSQAKGEYIAFVDNDIVCESGWLEKCLKVFEKFPDRKYLVTPIQYPGVMAKRYDIGSLEIDGERYRLNTRAGSNCFVVRRKDFYDIGEFIYHRIAGSKFNDKFISKGYFMVVTPRDMAKDIGLRKGYDFKAPITVQRTLRDGTHQEFIR